eukprot:gnl/Spiro4/18736_TR10013_c0_g1_i1.p1 gnl/Spiro4/18736_TR10013_c0_g1~~gnl/Spiro4/18736_TR10013_c0_g1_i1.p1  ORF type:complete len:211 (+),score=52.61 gnl/Spiro4/18736_TR10013_c0_g1_i1:29-634(+)
MEHQAEERKRPRDDKHKDPGKHKDKKRKKHHKESSKKHKGKKEKKEKKDKKAKKVKPLNQLQFGKYGVLTGEQDHFKVADEFHAWIREVKMLNEEILPPFEKKKLWVDFMEDFNTATMPSKKYYNLEAWEARRRQKEARRSAKGRGKERTTFNDEEDRRKEVREAAQRRKDLKLAIEQREKKMQAEEKERAALLRSIGKKS